MIDLEKIKAIYNIGRDLNIQDLHRIFESTKNKFYSPSDYLIKEGTIKREVFYIKKGLIRSFAINNKGDEITMALYCENYIISSPDTILFNQPSRFYFQALEQTEILSIDYDILQSVFSENPKLEQNRKHILHRIIKESLWRIESFVLYSPEERYLRYIESYPEIANRVPDKYIANVLGITPVSLSRIRKRISNKKR